VTTTGRPHRAFGYVRVSTIDRELLMVGALADMEPVHAWALDRLVRWRLWNGAPHLEPSSWRTSPWRTSHFTEHVTEHAGESLVAPALGTLERHGLAVRQSTIGKAFDNKLGSALSGGGGGGSLRDEDQETVVATPLGQELHSRLLAVGAFPRDEHAEPSE